MSALRVLGLSYLATASLFSLAIFFSDHAALRMVSEAEAGTFAKSIQAQFVTPLLAFARLEDEKIFDPQVSLVLSPPEPNEARLLAHAVVPTMPAKKVEAANIAAPEPLIIAPDLPDLGEGYGGAAPPPLLKFAAPEAANLLPPDVEGASPLSEAQRVAVTSHLAQNLTPVMLKNFDLFLYVSTAAKGPLAQRLYVFRKDASGALQLAYDWVASTGREEYEITALGTRTKTDTPAGLYELDPARMYRAYHSTTWDLSMPYAMFFNWENHGDQTGIAIHAAVGDNIEKLGRRASAGCVHISPGHARLLYEMIRGGYKGQVPRFAYDKSSHTMGNRGEMMRDAKGNLVMADGYKVLIDIENLSGANMVAALD